jgi:hypothetical protein
MVRNYKMKMEMKSYENPDGSVVINICGSCGIKNICASKLKGEYEYEDRDQYGWKTFDINQLATLQLTSANEDTFNSRNDSINAVYNIFQQYPGGTNF